MLRAALSLNPLWEPWENIDMFAGVHPKSVRLKHVGVVAPPWGGMGYHTPPDDWPELCTALPDIAQYVLPERSASEERRIIEALVEHQRASETPAASVALARANDLMASAVPKVNPPAWLAEWRLPTPMEFYDATCRVVPDANPGFPCSLFGREKAEVVFEHFGDLYHLVCVRILAILYASDYVQDPVELVGIGAASPIKVEIKKEFIKAGKLPRIILIVDLSNDVFEELCYGPYNFITKRRWGSNWSVIGIGFGVDDTTRFLSPLQETGLATSDVPKFDWTVTEEEDVLTASLVAASYELPQTHPGAKFLRRFERVCAKGVFVFSDGVVWCQVLWGGRKTGRRETSRFNTDARSRRAIAVNVSLTGIYRIDQSIKAAGDDCTEPWEEGVEDLYEAFNFPLRDFEKTDREGLSFCSHTWSMGQRPVGQRIAKSAAKLLHAKGEVLPIAYYSFVQEYSNHPEFHRYLSVILGARPRVITQAI